MSSPLHVDPIPGLADRHFGTDSTLEIDVPSKAELVYSQLRKRILDDSYTPGYRLVLAQIAESFDVSVVPVREAVRRLEAEGLVVYRKNIGAAVAGIDPSDFADAMQATALLEGYVTALAAPHLSASDLERAVGLNDQMGELRGELFDPLQFTRLNEEFHDVLCGPCPNQHLSNLLTRERERMGTIRRSTFTYVPGRSRTSVEEHDNLLRLVSSEKLDLVRIESAAREHKVQTLQYFLDRDANQ